MKKLSIFFLLFISNLTLLGQEKMSLESLVQGVLAENLDIEVSRNEYRMAQNLATPGQVGLFPDFTLSGNAGYSRNNTSLEFAGDLPAVEVDGAENLNYSASLGLNYVLFNGFQRTNNLKLLQGVGELSELQVQALSESYALEAIFAYLDLILLKKNEEIASNSLQISARRLEAVNLAYANGSKTKVDQLSAEIDYNNDSLQVNRARNAIRLKSYDINLLLGRNPQGEIQIEMEVPVPSIKGQDIEQRIMSRNTNLLLAQVAFHQSALENDIAKGKRAPLLSASGSYGLSTAENGAGIILSQQNQGLTAGLSLSMPIFQGRRIHTAIENTEVDIRNSQLQLKSLELSLRSSFYKLQIQEEEFYQVLEIARRNEALAVIAMERAEKAYSFGQIGFTDLRQSQLSLLASQIATVEAEINLVKVAFQFDQLSGELLK